MNQEVAEDQVDAGLGKGQRAGIRTDPIEGPQPGPLGGGLAQHAEGIVHGDDPRARIALLERTARMCRARARIENQARLDRGQLKAREEFATHLRLQHREIIVSRARALEGVARRNAVDRKVPGTARAAHG